MSKKTLLLDTNVLLDALAPQRPRQEDSLALLHNGSQGLVRLLVPMTQLKDSYYLLNRYYHDEPHARKALTGLINRGCVEVVDVLANDATIAFTSNEPYFEDGLVRAVAERLDVDAIVSHDVRAFQNSPIGRVSALEALAFIKLSSGFLPEVPVLKPRRGSRTEDTIPAAEP